MTATRNVKGLLGTKLGMTQVWDENNKLIPVTVVQADSNVITQLRNAEVDGYVAVQIGYGQIDPRKVTKPLAGHFEKAGVTPRRHVVELRTADAAEYELGQELSVELFAAGQKIDVIGTTKGKGFAGGMKRWGFGGLRATHGVSVSHRSLGSTGQRQDPGRVFKNKKMAGHMGAKNRTQQNLEIVRTDALRGLLFVKGSVPGSKGGWLMVKDSVKIARPEEAPYPAGLLENAKEIATEMAPAGFVEEAAVHEIPALPSDAEVAAIAAEQEAGAVDNQTSETDGATPDATENKEG